MVWLFSGGAAFLVLSVVLRLVFHPVRSAAAILKLGLGVTGFVCLASSFISGDFGYGFLGVLLLVGAGFVSRFQEGL